MEINVDKATLDAFEMQNMEYLIDTDSYTLEAGRGEYRLYSYLSSILDNITILDIGTNQGRSAVALSHNPNNRVISYDIEDHIHSRDYKLFEKANIEFKLKNVMEDLTTEFIQTKNIKLIMIDICHTGPPEREIMDRLAECGFKGIVLLDDIWHPDMYFQEGMQKMWNELPWRKRDISELGHWSGTGIVYFD